VDFVHVEIYDDLQVQSFDELTAVPATDEWGLPSEPWVFVVGADGRVTASFEGAASDEEMRTAIDAVAS
ncbi:MAG: thioredoxin family protein, partial [Acidimicrobiia bacterium]